MLHFPQVLIMMLPKADSTINPESCLGCMELERMVKQVWAFLNGVSEM